MQIQSKFVSSLLFVALIASVWDSTLASAFCVRAANAANRIENHLFYPAEYSTQDKVSDENPPLPEAVLNAELKALDGSIFKLADYRGKVVLVNLWATWLGPSRLEIPELIKVNQEFNAKGVEIIGLTNEDPEVDGEKVQKFVFEYGVPYKIGWSDQSFALALMQGQIRNSIPQTFVISRDGRVVKRFLGYNPAETPAKLRKALADAIKVD